MDGLALSEDVIVMISPDFYEEFAKPYNERIAKELGGIAIHSCGSWKHNFRSVINTRGIRMIDLAMSKLYDPGPNSAPDVIDAFSGSGVPLKARVAFEDKEVIRGLLEADIKTVLQFPWHDDPAERQRRYDDAKGMWESVRGGRGHFS
jgi:hypothetical protein